MITPYTQAAQAPRFDIYDPFPFQEVASMALKKDKAYGDFLADVDKYSADIANISAASNKDKEYLANTKAAIDSTLSDALSKGVDLGDGFAANKLMRDVYKKVDVDALKKIKGTSEKYDAFQKSALQAGANYDPLMNRTLGEISEWNSAEKGEWQGNVGIYQDAEQEINNIIKNLEPTFISDDGEIETSGVSRGMIKEFANKNANTFLKTKPGQYQVERYRALAAQNGQDLSNVPDEAISAEILADRLNPYYKKDISNRWRINQAKAKEGTGSNVPSIHQDLDMNKAMMQNAAAEKGEELPTGTRYGRFSNEALSAEYNYNPNTGLLEIADNNLKGLILKVADIEKSKTVGEKQEKRDQWIKLNNAKLEKQKAENRLAAIKAGTYEGPRGFQGATTSTSKTVSQADVAEAESKLRSAANKYAALSEQTEKEYGFNISQEQPEVSRDEELDAKGNQIFDDLKGVEVYSEVAKNNNTTKAEGKYYTKVNSFTRQDKLKDAFEKIKDTPKWSGLTFDKFLENLGAYEDVLTGDDAKKVSEDGKDVAIYRFDNELPSGSDPNAMAAQNLAHQKKYGTATSDFVEGNEILYKGTSAQRQDYVNATIVQNTYRDLVKRKSQGYKLDAEQQDFIDKYEKQNSTK